MRTYLAALLLLALSACGVSETPHSDYFVVAFESGRSELPPAGRAALSYATRDADRGAPRAVAVKAYVRADDTNHELAEQRMKVIADALVQAGVARNIIQLVPQPADPDEFTRLGNGVVVQIELGDAVVPPPPIETEAE
jgi:hypothetical protein